MSTTEKAARLRAEGKVKPVPARTYEVEGDHDTYLVTICMGGATGATQMSCTCPARGACSHLLAAADTAAVENVRERDPGGDPFDRVGRRPAARIVR